MFNDKISKEELERISGVKEMYEMWKMFCYMSEFRCHGLSSTSVCRYGRQRKHCTITCIRFYLDMLKLHGMLAEMSEKRRTCKTDRGGKTCRSTSAGSELSESRRDSGTFG